MLPFPFAGPCLTEWKLSLLEKEVSERHHHKPSTASFITDAAMDDPSHNKDANIQSCLGGHDQLINLKELQNLALAKNGLLTVSNRQRSWPKMLAAHLVIYKSAAAADAGTDSLHHPTTQEISAIKYLIAESNWESKGVSLGSCSTTALPGRRVSFQLQDYDYVAFSTNRKQDQKILRKILVHLKRTCPDFQPNKGTCCAIALLLTVVESASLTSIMVNQLVSYHWSFFNNQEILQADLQQLLRLCNPRLFRLFATFGKIPSVVIDSWIPSLFAQNVSDTVLLTRIWDVLIASHPYCLL